jgi:hypothetical protein
MATAGAEHFYAMIANTIQDPLVSLGSYVNSALELSEIEVAEGFPNELPLSVPLANASI